MPQVRAFLLLACIDGFKAIGTTPQGPTTSQEPLLPLACGQKGFDGTPTTKIVNGQDANKCEYSWQVSLRNCGVHYCGGSILSRDWILTAAHCVTQDVIDTDTIVVGDYSRLSHSDSYQEEHGIDRIIAHPSYNSSTAQYDFALIKLRTPITFNSCVGPICLPSSDAIQGKRCMISGWGTLKSKGSWPDILQEGEVTLSSNLACAAAYRTGSSRVIHDSMLCASGVRPNGLVVDACQGDSGGPLACLDSTTRTWVLHGVTSWGKGCANSRYPGVYARVWHVLDWIRDEVQSARNGSSVPRSCSWRPVVQCPCTQTDLSGCRLPACSSCAANGASCVANGPLPDRSQDHNINNCFGFSVFVKQCGNLIDDRGGSRAQGIVNSARRNVQKQTLGICLGMTVVLMVLMGDR